MTEPETTDPHSLDSGSIAVSLAFWLVLFGCGCVHALVTLSPRLVAYLELRHEYVVTQHRLVTLENRNRHLARVADALEHDPRFAEELVRVDLDAAEPGEERIPVDAAHHLRVQPEAIAPVAVPEPWYLPIVRRVADDARLRTRLLIATAVVVVLAFGLLHDANGPLLGRLTNGTRRLFGTVTGRYRRDASESK